MSKDFLLKLTGIVEANLANEAFGAEDLAREMGMSHSSLHRKLKTISNQTISQFIREARLKKAKELLLKENLTVAEISYRVGFGSPTYFNKCFHEYFGVAPGGLKNKETNNEPEAQPLKTLKRNPKGTKILNGLIVSLLFLIPLSYFLLNIEFSSNTNNVKEKSIAVLPFKYMSDEPGKQYLADGLMDAILNRLSKINDLRVISRTSVEQYRNSIKPAKTIGQDLNVAYILEGSLQKDGNQTRIILQLIKTSDEAHAWSNEYDRDWNDIFAIQSEVAEKVAKELQIAISPEELQLIRKIPTSNLSAYDFYLRGKDELEKFEFRIKRDSITLLKAQLLFQKALELDSTFALAYTGLAAVQFWNSEKAYLTENYLDSVLILANKALAFDTQCSEAYYYRGFVYSENFKTAEALKEIDIALKYNPNDWRAYTLRAFICEVFIDDVGAISNHYEAVLRNRGAGLPHFLTRFSYKLANFGFPDLARKYNQQALILDGDSIRNLRCLAYTKYIDANFENAYQIAKIVEKRDTLRTSTFGLNNLSIYCHMTGRYEEVDSLILEVFDLTKKTGEIELYASKRIAYALWQLGRTKEAKFYINQQIKISLESIKLGRMDAIQRKSQFDLAEMYAFIGDKEKAYQYLDEVNKNHSFPLWWVILFKYDPLLNSIRQEPRFQAILKDVESKYLAERERVRKWLVEQKML